MTMKYPKILAGLRSNITSPGFAERFATSIGEPGTGGFQRQNWIAEYDSLSEAHRFEFNDDVSFLLTMTDNELNGDYHLPYPLTFIDCNFTIPDIRGDVVYHGILLTEYDRIAIGPSKGGDMLYEIVTGHLPIEIAHVDMSIISATAFIHFNGRYVDVKYPLSTDAKAITKAVNEVLRTKGYKEMGSLETSMFAKKEHAALIAMTANFLDLLNTHDVAVGHVPQSKATTGKNNNPNPPRHVVRLSLPLQEYVKGMRRGQNIPYDHAFWVRGHWKHWKAERFAASGKQGTKTWTPPYVKGRGILVRKPYEADTDYSKY